MKYASPSAFWEFVQCQNYQGLEKIGQPETALKCASTAQIDWVNSGVGDCAGLDGSGKAKEGVRLLQNSVNVTEELGIEYVTKIYSTYSPFDTYDQEKLHDPHQSEAGLHSRRHMEAMRGERFLTITRMTDATGYSQNGHNVHDFVRQINEEYNKLNGDITPDTEE